MWSCPRRKSCGRHRRQRRIRASREYPETYPKNPRIAPGRIQKRFLAAPAFDSRLEMTGQGRALLSGFAEKLWRSQPNDFRAWGSKAPEFEHGNSGFLESGEVMLGAQGGRDQIVEMRSVTENEDDGIVFVFREFTE